MWARTVTSDHQGQVNSFIRINGVHDISIYNITNTKQTYKLEFYLECIEGHFSATRHVTIDPLGYYENSSESYLFVQPEKIGRFAIRGRTNIEGETETDSDSLSTLYVVE